VRGVIHVHSDRSDGTGSVDEIAAAAARAGLDFIVLTDHGNAAREPDGPTYRSGVLMVDGAEVSTAQGHVVVVGLSKAPYPLGGQARDVLEDVRRLGGMSIVAHPLSPDVDRQWSGGDDGFDGFEWLNADSEWRDEPLPSLLRSLLTYWLRPTETLGAMLDTPSDALARWDSIAATRQLVGVAAADAHARVGLPGAGDPYDGRPVLRVPGYEWIFRASSTQLPTVRFTRDAARDAEALLGALRAGAVVTAVDALASGGYVEFSATSGRHRGVTGASLALDGPVAMRVATPAVRGARTRLIRDGRVEQEWDAGRVNTFEQPAEPASYRVEVVVPGRGADVVPWLVSNHITFGRLAEPMAGRPPRVEDPSGRIPLFVDGDGHEWGIEKSARADGRVAAVKAVGGTQLSVRFALGGSLAEHPFVAASRPVDAPPAGYDAIYLTVRSTRAMRLSVQLRAGREPGARRWAHSVYLDETPREVRLPFSAFHPVGTEPSLTLADVTSLLLVVDTVNTALGTSGQFWVEDLLFGNSAHP
jgi:hypothetical protein